MTNTYIHRHTKTEKISKTENNFSTFSKNSLKSVFLEKETEENRVENLKQELGTRCAGVAQL